MTFIDNLLNRITMYRLALYYLIALVAFAMIFGAVGWLPYNPFSILASTLILVAACWLVNTALAKLFRVPANFESVYITALILALIISPVAIQPFNAVGFLFLLAAAVFAMASKYVLAIHRKHIFNPAAIAVVLTGFVLGQYASWWVGGNLPMLAFVVVGGLLVVRKIQRFDLVLSFAAAALVSIVATNPGFDPLVTAEKALIHTSLFFFAFVMLTEPVTTPPTRPLRIAYGLLVGALFAPAIHFGPFYSTPELALVVGNIFSFAVSPKRKYILKLKEKTRVGTDIYDFVFAVPGGVGASALSFRPGQYMEFTLPPVGADDRGNRRYFTIASSPTEPELHLGVKFYGEIAGDRDGRSSSFKKKLLALTPGDTIMAGQLAGDFTLPRGKKNGEPQKFAFLAGGIGITPFRSMIKYLSDHATEGRTAERPDIVLLYSNRSAAEVAYRDVFDEAAHTIGLKTVYINTETDGRADVAAISREIPDYRERMFYISGTHAMVVSFEKILHDLGVPRTHIKTDFFPGFA